MFKKIASLILLLFVLAPGLAWASSCHDELKALHGLDPSNTTAKIENDVGEFLSETQAAAKLKSLSCDPVKDPDCAKEVIEEAINEKKFAERFKDYFRSKEEKACVIGKQRSSKDKIIARSNMILNLGAAGIATWGVHKFDGHMAEKDGKEKPKFNWAFLAATTGFVVYRSIIQCQNELGADSLDGLTAKQKFWIKFWRYTKMNAIANSMFVGMLMVQDWVNGENPLDPENLKSYGLDFAFGMLWDSGWAVSHIRFFDALLLDRLPLMRERMGLWIQQGILKPVIAKVNGRRVMMLVVNAGSQVPGFTVEALSRFALTASRTAAYLGARNTLQNFVFGIHEDRIEESVSDEKIDTSLVVPPAIPQ